MKNKLVTVMIITWVLLSACGTKKTFDKEARISFTELGYEDALAEARKQNKKVYIFFYADWCGYCKKMAKNVFQDPELGDLYNKEFINIRIDTETEEGGKLSGAYGVRVLPTQVYLDENGNPVNTVEGYTSIEQTIQNAKDI